MKRQRLSKSLALTIIKNGVWVKKSQGLGLEVLPALGLYVVDVAAFGV